MSNYRTILATINSYTAEYQAYLDRLVAVGIPTPDTYTKFKHNEAVASIIAAGLWSKIESLKFIWNTYADAIRIDVRRPSSHSGTFVGSNVFTANQGIKGNGSSSRFDVFIPSASSGIYQLSSAGIFVYLHSSPTTGTILYSRASGSTQNSMNLSSTTAQRLNSGNGLTGGAFNYTTTPEVKAHYRDSSTALRLFREKVKTTRTAQQSAALSSAYVSFFNEGAAFSDAEIGGILAFTSSLTDAEHNFLVDINNTLIS